MIRDINLSQLLALIAVSLETKQIKMCGGDLTWLDMERVDVTTFCHSIHIGWKSKVPGGAYADEQHLCMKLIDIRKPRAWEDDKKYFEPILRAYYYNSGKFNSYTKFLYEIIGNEIDIIDDIGLVGNGSEYKGKNLLKIDPHNIYAMKVRNEGRWSK